MSSELQSLTQLHLKSFGISDYLVRQIVKGLKTSPKTGGFNEYAVTDVRESVQAKLLNPKTKPETRKQLQRLLTWLNGESNVIAVDFLKHLSPEKRIEILMGRIEKLEAQEQMLNQETDQLLRKAKKMVAKR